MILETPTNYKHLSPLQQFSFKAKKPENDTQLDKSHKNEKETKVFPVKIKKGTLPPIIKTSTSINALKIKINSNDITLNKPKNENIKEKIDSLESK